MVALCKSLLKPSSPLFSFIPLCLKTQAQRWGGAPSSSLCLPWHHSTETNSPVTLFSAFDRICKHRNKRVSAQQQMLRMKRPFVEFERSEDPASPCPWHALTQGSQLTPLALLSHQQNKLLASNKD